MSLMHLVFLVERRSESRDDSHFNILNAEAFEDELDGLLSFNLSLSIYSVPRASHSYK